MNDDIEDEFYLKRLDAGLFILQLIVCTMLENCCAGVPSVSIDLCYIIRRWAIFSDWTFLIS